MKCKTLPLEYVIELRFTKNELLRLKEQLKKFTVEPVDGFELIDDLMLNIYNELEYLQ